MKPNNSKSIKQTYLKRPFDVLLSCISLLLFSPLIALIWILIKVEDGENPIFSQERIGKGGKSFQLYKFRTMRIDAEKDSTPKLCEQNDSRLTKIGGFLRSHHLDELPQLWNVLRGHMSFVGYRPERQFFIDKIIMENPDYVLLYQIRPGVFSKATLYNGYTDTMAKMLKRLDMDLEYLKKQSLLYDVKIIGLTALSIITGKKF